jgi:hypothetical protein
MFRLMMICYIALSSAAAVAQRQFVVVDVETRSPIRGVNVMSSAQQVDTTDWQGLVVVPDTCLTLSLTHVKYESRILNVTEVKDTIFLISKLMGLPELTVFGKGKGEDQLKELKRQMRIAKTEAQLAAADPAAGFNVLGLIGKLLKRRKDKRKEKFLKMLEDY